MCGHDMHVTWLVGATKLLAEAKTTWRGTLMAVFQPGEETAEGAQAMIDDGLFKRFPKPDVVLGQHVMVGPSGTVAGRAGAITSAADSLQIRLFGRGAHGSMPQASIDPVVMAAATVMRLQTIVSREIAAAEAAVVTVGVLQAGTKENVIPDEAIIKLNVRTFDAGVRTRVLAAIERIVNAEAAASGAPRKPEITTLDHYPLNVNDREASKRVVDAFRGHFGAERVRETGPAPASEDFGSFGTEWHVPSVFWFVGGTDPETYAKAKAANKLNELPVNHSPKFAPVLHPTLQTGVETLVVATALAAGIDAGMSTRLSESGIMEKLPLVLDLTGTFVFALSGALAGVKRELDLFGVLVLSFAAANSGGITRDLLIGVVPPGAVADWRYLGVSLFAGIITFYFSSLIVRMSNSVLIFDAAGLALFAVTGASKALAHGLNPVMAIVLGMVTGIGGGMVRDVLLAEIPTVLRAELYAVAALAAAAIVVVGHMLQLPVAPVTAVALISCFSLRVMAIRRGWRLPVAKISGSTRSEYRKSGLRKIPENPSAGCVLMTDVDANCREVQCQRRA